MSYEAEKWARAQTVGNSTAKAVLKELAFRMNGDTGLCCPSVKTLCTDLEIRKDETVIKALARLESIGLIVRTFERGEKGNILRTIFTFPTFRAEEWQEAPQKTEDGCSEKRSTGTPKNGRGYSEKRTGVLRKTGLGYSEKRSVTRNIEQGNKPVIEPSLSSEIEISSETQSEPLVKKPRRKPSTPCPWKDGDAIPEDLLAWSAETYPTIDAREEFRKFVGWALSKDMRYARWDQAFRNWMGNALKYRSQRGTYGGTRQPVDRSHFAHEKPMNQKDFSMSDQQLKDMEYIFALDAEEAATSAG